MVAITRGESITSRATAATAEEVDPFPSRLLFASLCRVLVYVSVCYWCFCTVSTQPTSSLAGRLAICELFLSLSNNNGNTFNTEEILKGHSGLGCCCRCCFRCRFRLMVTRANQALRSLVEKILEKEGRLTWKKAAAEMAKIGLMAWVVWEKKRERESERWQMTTTETECAVCALQSVLIVSIASSNTSRAPSWTPRSLSFE